MEKKSTKVRFHDWEIDFRSHIQWCQNLWRKKIKKQPEDWNSVLSKVLCRINTNLKDQGNF